MIWPECGNVQAAINMQVDQHAGRPTSGSINTMLARQKQKSQPMKVGFLLAARRTKPWPLA